MNDFQYAAATTVDEAVSLLAAQGEKAKIMAGGTDIIVQLREGQRDAELVVDIKKIPELLEVDFDAQKGLSLGGSVPCCQIYGDARILDAYPGLADATRIIGGWQIQSRASVGGNLCNSSPAADSIPALIALDVTCQIAGPDGPRSIKASEFCTGPGRNALQRGELLVKLEFPPSAAKTGSAYLRFIPRNEMDIGVAGSGVWLQLDESGQAITKARIALSAVGPTPLFAAEASDYLAGKPATEASFAQAGELAKKVATPISDMRGTAEYRTHLVGVLTRRALTTAAERAKRQR